jgi:Cu(I)/Ag(I) efflux system membrane fusion protein
MPLPKLTEVSSALKGKLVSVSHKTIGDTVTKGELLYSLDSPEWRELQQNYIDTVSDLEQTENRQLRQRLQALGMKADILEQLTETGRVQQIYEVFAPKGGNIAEWHAKKDEEIVAGSKVVTLGGVNRIPIVMSLFEGQGTWVRRGQKIKVRVPNLPGVEFDGQIDRTDREINFSTRTLPVYAGFSTTDARLRYGMLVEVSIEAAVRQNVLRIPREALIRTGKGSRVILDKGDGRFLPVWVTTGIESEDYIEIISGLEEGQEIVVSGQFLIDSESSLAADFQRMNTADESR